MFGPLTEGVYSRLVMGGMRLGLAIGLLVFATGCEGLIHGVGTVYVWNGTEHPIEITGQGRSAFNASLRLERGAVFNDVVVGPYIVTIGSEQYEANVNKERLTVINADRAGCFARSDVLGMYQRGKDPVRVLELYEGQTVMELQDTIDILPDDRLPVDAPRKPFPFQRFSVVPCHLVTAEDHPEEQVAQYVRRLR